jgi:hypothetical protein
MNMARLVFFGFGLLAFAGWASAAESLCAANEQVFFNCPIKDSTKLLSVCGRAGDYLQYRFGSHGKPELVYPKTKEGSLTKFRIATEYVPSAFYESHQLSFQSGETDYRVYAITEQDGGRDSEPARYGGVIVSTASGRDITMPCGAVPTTELGVLVRKPGAGHREQTSPPTGDTRASFELCQAMPFNSSDSEFRPAETEYMLRPFNDAFMLGLHNLPEAVELRSKAAVRLVVKPRHGSLAPDRKSAGQQAAWQYIPDAGFIGNDRAEFVVRGQDKTGEAVELRLLYKLRVTPEKRRAYLRQPDPPLLSIQRTYCLIPTILLDGQVPGSGASSPNAAWIASAMPRAWLEAGMKISSSEIVSVMSSGQWGVRKRIPYFVRRSNIDTATPAFANPSLYAIVERSRDSRT